MLELTLVDLFCGMGGWTRPAIARGWSCIGFDTIDHGYPATLILKRLPVEVPYLRRFNPDLIVASPPCEEYARKHLPWSRHQGPVDERLLRWAVSLIGKFNCPVIVECSQFAARHVEGARPCGSFYLWGNVPALLPKFRHLKTNHAGNKENGQARRAAFKAQIPNTLADWILEFAERTATRRRQKPEDERQ